MRHDGWDWHLHATPSDAALEQRMAVEAGMAMVDVVRRGELGRLKRCAGEDCTDVYVDLSKNRSRRFCDGSCGNRSAVAAYRARRRAWALLEQHSPPEAADWRQKRVQRAEADNQNHVSAT